MYQQGTKYYMPIQPAGAHDAYNEGDKVSRNGKHWISDINANVYGWSEVEA